MTPPLTQFGFYHSHRTSGWIEVVCGSMFSGKTEELIRRVKRAQIARQTVQVFKPLIDDRYAPEFVNSHAGAQLEAVRAKDAQGVWSLIDPEAQVIAVDEAQFFDHAIVDVCQALANQGKRVICTGLDLDFRGEPFGLMSRLLAVAEHVEKLQAICMVCGAPATRSQRLIDGHAADYEDPVIQIGASETYEARCRGCHEVPNRPTLFGDAESAVRSGPVSLPSFRAV